MPEQIELSVTQKLDDRWTVMAGATWTRWSRFKELKIMNDGGGIPVSQGDGILSYVPENWKDVWAFALGASYQYSDRLMLKTGYAYDQSPVQNEYRTARIPDSNRNWLTVGAKYNLMEGWTIDAAYGYMFAATAKVNDQGHYGLQVGQSLNGEYKLRAHVLSASLTKRF